MAAARQTCTDHCSSCGQHFHGLGAFDAHLLRINEGPNRSGAQSYQLSHLEGGFAPGLERWTDSGWCELGRVESEHPVTIWRVLMTEERRAQLASLSDTSSRRDARAPRGEV